MNIIDAARKKTPTPLMRKLARIEHQDIKIFSNNIATGKTVILKNNKHRLKTPCAVGKGLRTKVNVNLGVSTDICSLGDELKKLKVSIENGADAVMDLSVGKNIRKIQKEIIAHSTIPIGTVPIYEIAQVASQRRKNFFNATKEDFLDVIERQANDGIDFFTIHSGITREVIRKIPTFKKKRIAGIVSRGGALLAEWIRRNNKENPLYECFDDILKIAKKFDITLSLGDGLRPGSILDATDQMQIYELKKLGQLARRAHKFGVQVIIEGPGHVPLNQIEKNIKLQKKICHGAPFYVLGPLVTDVAPGYDHITSSIGGALAGFYGADFLCYVTPAEHLKLPSIEDVKEGLIATRIAGHAADIARGLKHRIDWDKNISIARKSRNWDKQIDLSIDPKKARDFRKHSKPHEKSVCTMCGEYCSIKISSGK
ncbi:phosphomethylpyrimidine synthase ThiC [Thermoproteota archaeon]